MKLEPKNMDALVATPIVQQTAFWGRVQRRLGYEISAFDVKARPRAALETAPAARGDFLVMLAPVSPTADCAYVPFGPELAPDTESIGVFLEKLSHELGDLLGPRCAFIRWDLPWTSVHASEPEHEDANGEWRGPPSSQLRELRMNIGTRDQNLWKAPRDILPPDTVLIDLHDTEDAILGRMHHKTRYNIRLAQRRGVVVDEGTAADLPEWYSMYLETTDRNHIEPLPLAYFQTLLDERAETSASPVRCRLLMARHDGHSIAGMLLAIAGPRATYMYGASRREFRNLMAPSLMQWSAMTLAKAQGCTEYDMFGAAPRGGTDHALAGVHRFKVGFGGRLVHREGCWDFPIDPSLYDAYRGWEESQILQRAVARR